MWRDAGVALPRWGRRTSAGPVLLPPEWSGPGDAGE
jgi:hypothetical protein